MTLDEGDIRAMCPTIADMDSTLVACILRIMISIPPELAVRSNMNTLRWRFNVGANTIEFAINIPAQVGQPIASAHTSSIQSTARVC
jgi:hypothetical protein